MKLIHKYRKNIVRYMSVVFIIVSVLTLLKFDVVMETVSDDAVHYETLEIAKESLNGNAIWGLTEEWTTDIALDKAAAFFAHAEDRIIDDGENQGQAVGGLPVDGNVTMESGVPYKLATGDDVETAYDGNDCIRLSNDTKTVTMNLETIGVYDKIFVFATTGGPATGNYADFNVTLNYTDGETSSGNFKLYDWHDESEISDYTGIEKYLNVIRKDHNYASQYRGTTDGVPQIQSVYVDSDANKLLKSVTFNLNGLNGDPNAADLYKVYCGIFAVTGATPQGVPVAPVANEATNVITNGENLTSTFTANWNSVDGATSYHLDVATDREFTNILTDFCNKEVGNVTSYNVSGTGLGEKDIYYYRVRAVNENGQGISSNRVATGVPSWIKSALSSEDYDKVEYDAETNTITINEDITLEDSLIIESDETVIINLQGNSVTAPVGKPAITAGSSTNVNLSIVGDGNTGSIIGSVDSSGNGLSVIDFSGATGESVVKVTGCIITASNGTSDDNDSTGDGGTGGIGIGASNTTQIIIGEGTSIIGGDGGKSTSGTGGNGGAAISGGSSVIVDASATVKGGDGGDSPTNPGAGGAAGTDSGTPGEDGQKHIHCFIYEVDSDNSSIVKYYCNNSVVEPESCEYQVSDALILQLTAENMSYNDAIYDRASITNEITQVSGDEASNIKYYDSDDNILDSAPITSGEYVAKVEIGGKIVQKEFEILPIEQKNITLVMNGYTFDETVVIPSITGERENPNVKYYYNTTDSNQDGVEWKDIESTTLEPGTYYMYAVLEATTNYKKYVSSTVSFTINANTMTGIIVSDVEKVYDGNEYSISVKEIPEGATVLYGFSENNCIYSRRPTYRNVSGSPYNIYYKISKRGYNDVKGSATLTITPREAKLSWDNTTFIYDGEEHKPTVTVTNLVNSESCEVLVAGAQKDYSETAYTATATYLYNSNYKLPDNVTCDFTIAQKEISISWGNTEFEYNGQPHKPTATIMNGLCNSDACEIAVSGDKIDAGNNYIATASIDNDNYKLKESEKTVSFKINPKSIANATITLDKINPSYTGSEISQTILKVELDGETLVVNRDYEIDDESSIKATECGEYTITINGIGNYKSSAITSWNIIDNTNPTGKITIGDNEWTSYNASNVINNFYNVSQNIVITASDMGEGIDKVYYYISDEYISNTDIQVLEESSWIENVIGEDIEITAENKYIVYVKLVDKAGNITYISSNGIIIDKTKPAIKGVTKDKTYCENVLFTVTEDNLDKVTVNDETVTPSSDGKYELEAGSTYKVVVYDKAGNDVEATIKVDNGHKYNEPIFTWSDSYDSAKANFVCINDSNHVVNEDATIKREIVEEATGTKKGTIKYIASLQLEGTLYDDSKIKETCVADLKEISKGSIATEIIVDDNMAEVKVENLTVDTVQPLLLDKELELIQNGQHIKVYLETKNIDNSVNDQDKKLVEAKLQTIVYDMLQKAEVDEGCKVNTGISYMDISLYKKIGSEESIRLINIGDKELNITIKLPDDMRTVNTDREYSIIRVHRTDDTNNPEVTVLPVELNNDESTISFKTDKFSTYALVYVDKVSKITDTDNTIDTDENIDGIEETKKEDNKTNKKKDKKDRTPNTRDKNDGLWYKLLLLSGIGILFLVIRRKKMHNR